MEFTDALHKLPPLKVEKRLFSLISLWLDGQAVSQIFIAELSFGVMMSHELSKLA